MKKGLEDLKPDIRDVHVYGGALLASAGAAALWWPAGLIVFGGLLVYLGLRRVG